MSAKVNSCSSLGLSDEEIRKRIISSFTTLVADLDADQMSDYLIEGLVITVVQWQEIIHKRLTKQGRCRELLNLLLTTKNPKATRVFLSALERNSQWQWILNLFAQEATPKETGGNESDGIGSESDRRLEKARLDWEKERSELIEKQRQLQEKIEELEELVQEYKDMWEVDGNIDGLATSTAKVWNLDATSRISGRSCKSVMERSYVSGKIHLKIVYTAGLHHLDVTVVACKGLEGGRNRCDPYVKLYVLPDEAKVTKRKTAVQYDTLSPVYMDTFSFSLSLNDDVMHSLWVSVWQKFKLRRNKLLGEIVIPLEEESLESEIDDWYYLGKELMR